MVVTNQKEMLCPASKYLANPWRLLVLSFCFLWLAAQTVSPDGLDEVFTQPNKSVDSSFSPGNDIPVFIVYVETGDKRTAGTNSKVYIKLYDEDNNESGDVILSQNGQGVFEIGETNVFIVPKRLTRNLGKKKEVKMIKLWKSNPIGFGEDDWYVNKITVVNWNLKKINVFPILRWVRPGSSLVISEFDTFLPNEDPNKDKREEEIQRKRQIYEYDQILPDMPVLVKNFPDDERISLSYDYTFQSTRAQSDLSGEFIMASEDATFKSIDAMKKIYKYSFHEPDGIDRWDSDWYFGYQRVAGIAPTFIESFTRIPDKFPVTDDLLREFLEGLTIQEAINQGRLFMVDLYMTGNVSTREGFVVCSPIALFYQNGDDDLMPIAIQLFQTPSATNPIFTPSDPPYTWQMVKMWFNNAEAQLHESVDHAGMTHLFMEGVAIAAHRNLSPSHPIFKVLAPHFLYLMNTNRLVFAIVLNEGGLMDTLLNLGRKGSLELITERLKTWRMDKEGTPIEFFKMKFPSNLYGIKNYPFQNDALYLWGIIETYIGSYVDIYYPDDTVDIFGTDEELYDWITELVNPKNGSFGGVGILGIPGEGKELFPSQLKQILTSIIFISSAGHASVNFPHYEEYAFPPNYPSLLKGKPPTEKDVELTEQDILDALPDLQLTLEAMINTKQLVIRATNSLGDFEIQYIYDPPALKVLEKFRKDLAAFEEMVDLRNEELKEPYIYLKPSNVPNAISI